MAFHKKESAHNEENCGRMHDEQISTKERRFDFWYPRIMTVALSLNLLLQILILVFRWYRL